MRAAFRNSVASPRGYITIFFFVILTFLKKNQQTIDDMFCLETLFKYAENINLNLIKSFKIPPFYVINNYFARNITVHLIK